ncbi:MAG TPA: tRNA pseudouridine(55) synthase TruB [Gemmatimonadaceae bacterium]|nr:tRNA pseudouridine(55) synthase TruB [Gemmatimonadaceae bacterium]
MKSDSPEGLVLVDKPAGLTSHDVVDMVRRAYGERSVGHLGTLDPFATGLLVLLVGRATRLATFLNIEPKVYEAVIAFGSETDTDDSTGEVRRSAAVPAEADVRAAILTLTGEIMQVPPAYSAKKVGGKRAYHAARSGEEMELAPASVVMHRWEVGVFTGDTLAATITCGGGTYIRALARDLGRSSGSAAHLASLRRTRVGRFDVADAVAAAGLRDAPPPLRRLEVTIAAA